MTTALINQKPVSSTAGIGQSIRILRAAFRNPLDSLPRDIFRKPILRRQVFHRDITYVMDPALIHEVLVTHSDALDKGEAIQRLLRPALGNGLLTAEGTDWRWQRRAMAPMFRAGGLHRFHPAMLKAGERARDRMLTTSRGEPVSVNTEMMRATFDVIVETMLSGGDGIDVEATATAVTNYLHSTRWANFASVLGVPEWVPHPGKWHARAAAARLRNQLESSVSERRFSHAKRNDLVDVLLEACDPETGRQMTDTEITDNLLTFLTAGHETTALGLAWTLDLLGRHPEIARRVHEEAASVEPGNPDRVVFTKQVFQEALRLYPAAPMIVRRVVNSFMLDGVAMEPDMVIIVPVYALHRHETVWEAPHVFDPERFAPSAVRSRPRYAYLPFGAGPRVCIGAGFAMDEAATILSVLLRDLRFVSMQAVPPEALMEITLRPAKPLLMRVEPRHRP